MADKTIIYSKQTVEPLIPLTSRIEWLPDGTCFEIKYVYEMTSLAFLKDRGEGLRFKVRADIIETYDYDDQVYKTSIVIQIVHAIRRNLTEFFYRKIMVKYFTRVFFMTIFFAVIYKIPYIFTLFSINRNDGDSYAYVFFSRFNDTSFTNL